MALALASIALAPCARRRQPPPASVTGLEEGARLYAVSCGVSRTVRGASAAKQATGGLAVITATLPQRTDAERLFADWSGRLPAAGTATLCGSSVLTTLPRTEQDALNRLAADAAARTRDVLSVRETWQIRVDLTCRPADARAATAIDDDLAVELGAADRTTLVPAWTPKLSAEQRLARHTYGLWFHHALLAQAPPDQEAAVVRAISARPPGSEEADRRDLRAQISALEDMAAAQEVAKIRQGAYGPFDAPTLDLLAQLRHRWPDPTTKLGRQLAERLGAASPDDSVAIAAGASAGSYETSDMNVSVFALTFRRPEIGLPAFVDWLCAERCADVRFRLKVIE